MSQPNSLADATGAIGRWLHARLNEAAQGLTALAAPARRRRRVLFVEQADGTLSGPHGVARFEAGQWAFASGARGLRGAEVEFRLGASRCVFRELELPDGARDFLDGVVRAQLDRLTPWRASEAAFGWSAAPAPAAGRIALTVAATKRQPLAPLLDIAADAVVVTTAREGAAPIAILSRSGGASARQARWRGALVTALAVSLTAAVAALAAQWTLGARWLDEADTLTAELAQRRAALMQREHAGDDPAALALDARKRATPAAVIVLEALSRAIPDDAYLTEMRLSGERLEIAGVGADAAALVKQIEQSAHFAHAAFTAPTLRGAGDRETFRIEAHVTPLPATTP